MFVIPITPLSAMMKRSRSVTAVGAWAAIGVAACQATESASANIWIFMKTSPMRITWLRRNSARCARLFDRLRSLPTCSAHFLRLGCSPSAPDRRVVTSLRHSLRGHKKKGCTPSQRVKGSRLRSEQKLRKPWRRSWIKGPADCQQLTEVISKMSMPGLGS